MKTEKNSPGLQRVVADIAAAWILLLRIPCPIPPRWHGRSCLADSAWAYPLIGGFVGIIGGAVYFAGYWLRIPTPVSSGLALAAMILVTGALHEDGFADFWDSFGGHDRARRLEIMRDSRIGAFGALALVFSVGLRWAAMDALRDPMIVVPVLVTVGALSRVVCILMMRMNDPARADGLGAAANGLTIPGLLTGLVVGAGLSAASLAALSVIWYFVATVAISLLMSVFSKIRFGGYTGDLLGAGQQFGEIVLLVLAVGLVS